MVEPDGLLTCYHIIQDVLPDGAVQVRFPHGEYQAQVAWAHAELDCALLRLDRPVSGVAPLPLALRTPARGATWQSYGFPAATLESGLLLNGTVQDDDGEDRGQRPALVLRSDNATAATVLKGLSGSPVLVDGVVVGQLHQIIPGEGDTPQFSVIYARPASILARLVRTVGATAKAANPYRGLMAFQVEDADLFFGREALIAKLVQSYHAMVAEPGAMRLLAIVGPSGSGKSSVARAGLLAALQQPLPEQPPLTCITCRPGERPIESLARALIPHVAADAASIPAQRQLSIEQLLRHRSPEGHCDGLRRLAADLGPAPLLVLVDQFEEVYALCAGRQEGDLFVELLLHAAQDTACRVAVLLTLRSDFLGEAQRYHPNLSRAVAARHELVAAMSADELRRAIAAPAAAAGKPLDDASVELLLAEMRGNEVALPLLQFALTEVWDGIHRGQEPLAALHEMGGVGGALAGRAQALYDLLPSDDQAIIRRALVQLVQLGDGTRDTRRRVLVRELCGHKEREEQVIALLRRFAQDQARLLTLSQVDGQAMVEVSHEALFEHWTALGDWINASRDDRRFHDRLAEAVKLWEKDGRPPGRLWRAPDLDLLAAYQARCGDSMTSNQVAFWQLSARQRRREQRLRQLLVGAGLCFVVALAGLYAFKEKQRVRDTHLYVEQLQDQVLASWVEEGRHLLLNEDRLAALMWLQRAYEGGSDTPMLRYLLAAAMEPIDSTLMAFGGGNTPIKQAHFSPDGKLILVVNLHSARLWNAQTGRSVHVFTTDDGDIWGARFVGHGERIVTASRTQVQIWDTDSGRLLRTLYVADRSWSSHLVDVEPSPDGSRIVTLGQSGTVQLWDSQSGVLQRTLIPGVGNKSSPSTVAFSADGSRVLATPLPGEARVFDVSSGAAALYSLPVAGSTGQIVRLNAAGTRVLMCDQAAVPTVLDTKSGAPVRFLMGHERTITEAAFSPDDRRIVTGSSDGTVRLWDAQTGELQASLKAHSSAVTSVAFSADGSRLLTGGADRTAQIWDTGTGVHLQSLEGHTSPIKKVRFSADGAYALTVSTDSSARLWDATRSRVAAIIVAPSDAVATAVFSPDGTRVAARDLAGTAHLWDATSGKLLLTMRSQVPDILRKAPERQMKADVDDHSRLLIFSPQGDKLLTNFWDVPELWDARQGTLLQTLNSDGKYLARFAAWSPDGARLVTSARHTGEVLIWDAQTGRPIAPLRSSSRMGPLAYNADGSLILAMAGWGQSGAVWDAHTFGLLNSFTHQKQGFFFFQRWMVAFSRDGRRIATAIEGEVQIYPIFNGKPVTLDNDSDLYALEFSQDGSRLITGGPDSNAHIWDTADGALKATLKGHRDAVYEAKFSQDGHFAITGSTDRTARIWDAQTGRLLSVQSGDRHAVTHVAFNGPRQQMLTASGDQTMIIWRLPLETRRPEDIARLIRCWAPYQFEQGILVPRHPDPSACPPQPGPR